MAWQAKEEGDESCGRFSNELFIVNLKLQIIIRKGKALSVVEIWIQIVHQIFIFVSHKKAFT